MTVVARAGAADGEKARRRRPPEILAQSELRCLLQACGRGDAGRRNRALFVVLWRAGLRLSEALALRDGEIGWSTGEIRVLHGKGDRARTVGVDPMAMAVLEAWRIRRRAYPRPLAGPLFCTITNGAAGRELSGSYVRQALRRTAARAGIEKNVRPHGLRHTHAVELSREGVQVNTIRRQLGHARLNTTAGYIDHLAAGEVVETMRRRAWPDGAAAPPTP